jgi:hypothetical protein
MTTRNWHAMVTQADKDHYGPVVAYEFGNRRKFYDKGYSHEDPYRTSDGEIYYPAGDSEGYFVAT